MNTYSPKPLKIVTVEDSAIVAQRLVMMLSELNHVEYGGNATNMVQALHLIAQKMPAVVILDIHLKEDAPLLSGIDLLKLLRLEYPSITVIILSNFSAQQYRQKCLSLGAAYFFDKTNDFDKVSETLKTLIQPNT